MSLVKRCGDGLYPTNKEHASPEMALEEAKRLAARHPTATFVVYVPLQVVVNNNGSVIAVPVTLDNKVRIKDMIDAMGLTQI